MSEDLGKKIQQIAQVLNQEELPDNVKELVSLLASSLNKNADTGYGSLAGDSSPTGDGSLTDGDIGDSSSDIGFSDTKDNGKTAQPIPDLNSDMMNTARNAMARINSANDPRINLLQAIKPFMNSKRQNKISNCIQILQLAGLSRLLNEHEK